MHKLTSYTNRLPLRFRGDGARPPFRASVGRADLFVFPRRRGPALRGELVDILFRRGTTFHVAGKDHLVAVTDVRIPPVGVAVPRQTLQRLGIRIDRHARVERRPHATEAVPLGRRAVRVLVKRRARVREAPEAAQLEVIGRIS